MGHVIFSDNGWQVKLPSPLQDAYYDSRGADAYNAAEFQGRRPVLVDDQARQIYVGEPDWYHHDCAAHHGVDQWNLDQGYFGGGPEWGGGNLAWYGFRNQPPAHHADVAQALIQAGFQIPNPEGANSSENGLDNGDEIDYDDEALWEDED